MIYYEGPILKIVIWVKGSQSYYLGALKKESTLKKIPSSEYLNLNQNERFS